MATKSTAAIRQYLDAHPGDYRTTGLGNSAIMIGANDIWGYDPVMLGRYEQFMTFAQSPRPDDPLVGPLPAVESRLFRLLRVGLAFAPEGDRYAVFPIDGALPHVQLVDGWLQLKDPTQILTTLSAASFDPGKTVILETAPTPSPVGGAKTGSAHLLEAGNGSLTIAADVPRPMLLLVTDSYSRYWQAVPLPGSSQSHYQVLPADYTLIGVPLDAGHHLIRLEYAPPGWVIGRWISLASLGIYLAAAAMFLARRRNQTEQKMRPGAQSPDRPQGDSRS